MHRILLVLVVAAVGIVAMGMLPFEAHAACVGFPGNHRAVVGHPPDLFFEAGVPSTQYIPHVYVNFNDGGGPQTDCGVSAVSSLSAVKVQATYGCPGSGCEVSNAEPVDVASGYPLTGPNTYRVGSGGSGGYPNTGPIPVIYDGTAPAGTIGTIEIVTQGEFEYGPAIASINVYIIAGTPPPTGALPPTWFMVTSDAQNMYEDTVYLDNELIDGNPAAKIFAMHFGNGMLWNHPIALNYDQVSERWRIRNEDGTPMPIGLEFVVHIDMSALTLTTYAPYIYGPSLVIDDPASNNNPYAVIVVTAWSSGAQRMRHPFAVAYVPPHWVVHFTDGYPLPESVGTEVAGFFVKVIGAGQYIDDSVLTNDPSGISNTLLSNGAGTDIIALFGRQSGNTKYLRNFCWTTMFEPIIATWNTTPLPPPANGQYNAVEGKYYGVSAGVSNTSTVFHEDNSPMEYTSPFNVLGPYRTDCPPSSYGHG